MIINPDSICTNIYIGILDTLSNDTIVRVNVITESNNNSGEAPTFIMYLCGNLVLDMLWILYTYLL